MKYVHRYLLLDFLAQFLLCAVGISIFMLGFVLYQQFSLLITYHLPVLSILWLLINQWPRVLLDVMPGAGLFAVILSLGRMVRDREIQVFRTSGWSFFRIIWPLLTLTLILSYAVFLWNDIVVPKSESKYSQAWTKFTRERTTNFFLTRKFIEGPEGNYFYIGEIDRRTGEMRHIMIYQTATGGFPRLITAQSGTINGMVWLLREGTVHEIGRDGVVSFEMRFKQQIYQAKRDYTALFAAPPIMRELNRAELRKMAVDFDKMGARDQASGYWLQYNMKMATPFALFVFTTLAIPFACLSLRSGRIAIFLPALLLYLAYFLVLTVMYALGSQDLLAPWLAAWGSNILFGGLSIVLLFIMVK